MWANKCRNTEGSLFPIFRQTIGYSLNARLRKTTLICIYFEKKSDLGGF